MDANESIIYIRAMSYEFPLGKIPKASVAWLVRQSHN